MHLIPFSAYGTFLHPGQKIIFLNFKQLLKSLFKLRLTSVYSYFSNNLFVGKLPVLKVIVILIAICVSHFEK